MILGADIFVGNAKKVKTATSPRAASSAQLSGTRKYTTVVQDIGFNGAHLWRI